LADICFDPEIIFFSIKGMFIGATMPKKKKTKPGAMDDDVIKRIKKRKEMLRKAAGKKKGK